jgi:hypothetical protein
MLTLDNACITLPWGTMMTQQSYLGRLSTTMRLLWRESSCMPAYEAPVSILSIGANMSRPARSDLEKTEVLPLSSNTHTMTLIAIDLLTIIVLQRRAYNRQPWRCLASPCSGGESTDDTKRISSRAAKDVYRPYASYCYSTGSYYSQDWLLRRSIDILTSGSYHWILSQWILESVNSWSMYQWDTEPWTMPRVWVFVEL